jgi:hypothetical protein
VYYDEPYYYAPPPAPAPAPAQFNYFTATEAEKQAYLNSDDWRGYFPSTPPPPESAPAGYYGPTASAPLRQLYVEPTTGNSYISSNTLDTPPDSYSTTQYLQSVLNSAPRTSYTQQTPLPTYVNLQTGETYVPKSVADVPPAGYVPTDALAAILESLPYTGFSGVGENYDTPKLSALAKTITPNVLNPTSGDASQPLRATPVNISGGNRTPRGLAQLAAPEIGPELVAGVSEARPTLNAKFQTLPTTPGFAEGGKVMRKFTPAELGSTFEAPSNLRELFDYQRNVVFNPQLERAESAERARMTPAEAERLKKEYMMRLMLSNAAPGYAGGGVVGAAQDLAGMGRRGDSVLVHMDPQEVKGLQALAAMDGTSLTINPYTGMPEAFKLKKLLKGIAKIAPFVLPFIPGLGPVASALLSGVAGGFGGDKKGFDFKRGLMSGIMSYGVGQLGKGLAAAGQTGGSAAAGASAGFTPEMAMSGMPEAAFASSAAPAAATAGFTPEMAMSGTPEAAMAGSTPSMAAAAPSAGFTPEMAMSGSPEAAMGGTPPPTYAPPPAAPSSPGVADMYRGAENLTSGGSTARTAAEQFKQGASSEVLGSTFGPTTAATMAIGGYGGVEGVDEQNKYDAAINAQAAEEEERKRRYMELFTRLMGPIPVYGRGRNFAEGGEIEMGGTTGMMNEPRMVAGAGDGMSDNVPASIEGVQEARLADGEFVIPADVVADIGNGSSSAGARKLYQMMDRIREARHGTTEQPPEVNAAQYMPA